MSQARLAGFVVVLLPVLTLSSSVEACTIGIADASVTEDGRPLLWKSRMWSGSPDNVVSFYDWGTYDYIGLGSLGSGYMMMGLNEAGLCTGNTLVGDGENAGLMNTILGNFGTVDEARLYIEDQFNAGTLEASGCFPFVDAGGDASIFEIDHSGMLIEYAALDPDRAGQNMLGWVVRANEFHENTDGTDDLSITGRYLSGAYNTYGLIQADALSARTIMQGDDGSSGYEFMRYGPGRLFSTIAQPSVCASMAVQGVALGEDPGLSTMWAMPGQANYGIAVPTWVAVEDVPDCLSGGDMAARANSLYGKGNESQVQASVLPMEGHFFDVVEEMLGHWRAEGRPDVDEMARVEATIAGDAYSLLACLDLGDASNQAPNVAIEEPNGPGLRLQFTVSASDDGAGLTYAWDFGDDETSGDPSPVHTYGGPGWYLVSCTVTDDDGVSNTDWVYVEALAGLRLDVINGAWGSVEVEPNEPGYADANTVVTLTAFPIEGRVFGHWDRYDPNYPDDANHATVDSNNPLTLVMDTDHHVTAVFKCGSGLGQVFPLLLCVLWLGFLRRGRDRC